MVAQAPGFVLTASAMPQLFTSCVIVAVLLVSASAPASAENTSGVPVPAPPAFTKTDPRAYGRQLADYVDRLDSGWTDSYARSTITIINARGDRTTSKIRQLTLEGRGGNKSLIRYMSPASVRGVAALTHEHHRSTDDSWLYLPASRRVRRISGANRTASFQGTEFTYEDMSRLVPSRYRWKYLTDTTVDGQPVFKLEAVPTYRSSGYSRLLIYIHRRHFRSERIEYFDKAGRLLKVLTVSGWQRFHGRFWRARTLDMHNRQTQKRSLIDTRSQFVTIKLYKKPNGESRKGLSEASFTRRALEAR